MKVLSVGLECQVVLMMRCFDYRNVEAFVCVNRVGSGKDVALLTDEQFSGVSHGFLKGFISFECI